MKEYIRYIVKIIVPSDMGDIEVTLTEPKRKLMPYDDDKSTSPFN